MSTRERLDEIEEGLDFRGPFPTPVSVTTIRELISMVRNLLDERDTDCGHVAPVGCIACASEVVTATMNSILDDARRERADALESLEQYKRLMDRAVVGLADIITKNGVDIIKEALKDGKSGSK